MRDHLTIQTPPGAAPEEFIVAQWDFDEAELGGRAANCLFMEWVQPMRSITFRAAIAQLDARRA